MTARDAGTPVADGFQPAVTGLACVRCGGRYPLGPMYRGCPACEREARPANLAVAYDLDALRRTADRDRFAARPRGLWRFHELLPVPWERRVSLGEGDTPLLHLDRLGAELGLDRLYAKDESRNPTWSYKDRLAALALAAAPSLGATCVVTASTGNHGAATAAYAARLALPCIVFTVASVPDTMKTLMQAYGAMLVALEDLFDRWKLMAHGVEHLSWYPTGNFTYPPVSSNPFGVEGYTTIAFEIAEALGWDVPEWVIVPTAFGDGLYGTYRGFVLLKELGFTERVPRMAAAEPIGPLADALARGLDYPEAVPGRPTIAFSIGAPVSTYQALAALRESGGRSVVVEDGELLEMQARLGALHGVYAEPSSVAAVVAARRLRETGAAGREDRVVAVLTSSGLKDYRASRRVLPEVPLIGPEWGELERVLGETYGYKVGGG